MSKALTQLMKYTEPLRLYKINEVDEYLRSNPYIWTGYRGNLSVFSCLKSTLFLHNETINIWTHLIGFVIFSILLVKDFLIVLSQNNANVTFADFFVLTCVLLCYQSCMLLSSLFHIFTCHSKDVSEKCLSMDLAGITLALLATYLSGIYYAFWCQQGWRDFYLLTVGGIFIVAAGMQLSPKFCVDEYSHIRIGLFTLWAIYGLIPTFHWVWLHGGFANGIVPAMLPRIFVMYGLCGLAFVFYITKLPERLFPGSLDIFGHSHQWWHILIFVALLFWHQTGTNFALFRLKTGCDRELEDDLPTEALRLWPF